MKALFISMTEPSWSATKKPSCNEFTRAVRNLSRSASPSARARCSA